MPRISIINRNKKYKKLMIANLIKIIFAMAFIANICMAQTNTARVENWGEPISGVQLSITTSNTFIKIGSKIQLTCLTRNKSTNQVIIRVSDPRAMFEVSLIGNSGELYEL